MSIETEEKKWQKGYVERRFTYYILEIESYKKKVSILESRIQDLLDELADIEHSESLGDA